MLQLHKQTLPLTAMQAFELAVLAGREEVSAGEAEGSSIPF